MSESILRRILKLRLRRGWMRMRMRRTMMSRLLFLSAIEKEDNWEIVI